MSEFLFILLVFALFFTLMLVIYNSRVKLKNYTVKTDKRIDGLKIALVSDFHNNKSLLKKAAARVCECDPDIVVISGDLVDRRRPDFKTARAMLEKLSAIAPVFYVTGNHEGTLGVDKVVDALDCGDILLNEEYKIYRDYSLLGLSDRPEGIERQRRDLVEVFSRLENFKIAVVHRPDEFEGGLCLADSDVDLVLCGHYHGGVVRIPFFGALMTQDDGFFPKYSKGKYQKNGVTMIVSGGAGNTVFPLRINNFPEIVCITVEN